jgi:1-deoxy-D-xylulose-5-phosphate synthase
VGLPEIRQPADLRDLDYPELYDLCGEIRDFVVHAVAEKSGHLGSNLGAVELTLALHRVFESPLDAVLWDTGHQAYVHKIVTGRQQGFENLREANGLSGYPSREESQHDIIENSHASTVLSYAYGIAIARDLGTDPRRHIVAVIGDGSMTGGMAYEALNNIGHSGQRVIIVLNDNGRSYAPTISNLTATETQRDLSMADHPSLPARITERLSHTLTNIRLNPVYVRRQRRLEGFLRDLPYVGEQAEKSVEAFKAAVREFLQPPSFFEALGVRYVGPVDGHSLEELETTFRNAVELSAEGPILVHVLTHKGRGYAPAEDDDEKHLHDAPVFDPASARRRRSRPGTRRRSPTRSSRRPSSTSRIVAITAAMSGPTGTAARSRRASPTASSTSASPSSTPSPARPAWRWAASARSSRSTARSSTAAGTRSCTTWRCTASRSCSASIVPASRARRREPSRRVRPRAAVEGARACGSSRRRARRSCR